MAYICYRPGTCKGCEHYKRDDDKGVMACFAEADMKAAAKCGINVPCQDCENFRLDSKTGENRCFFLDLPPAPDPVFELKPATDTGTNWRMAMVVDVKGKGGKTVGSYVRVDFRCFLSVNESDKAWVHNYVKAHGWELPWEPHRYKFIKSVYGYVYAHVFVPAELLNSIDLTEMDHAFYASVREMEQGVDCTVVPEGYVVGSRDDSKDGLRHIVEGNMLAPFLHSKTFPSFAI